MEKLLEAIQKCASVSRRDSRALQTPLDDEIISELLRALQHMLSTGLIPGETFFRFFLTASKNIPTAPEIHELLKEVTTGAPYAALPTVTKERVYLVMSLSVPGSLMRTAQRCFLQIDTLSAFYSRDSPFFSDAFVTEKLVPALMAVARIRFALGPFNTDMLKFFDVPAAAPPQFGPSEGQLMANTLTSPKPLRGGDALSSTPKVMTVVASSSEVTENSSLQTESVDATALPLSTVLKKKKRAKLLAELAIQCDLPTEERSGRRFRDACVQIAPEVSFASTQCVHSLEHSSNAQRLAVSGTDEDCDPVWNDDLLQRASTHELNVWEQALMAREAALAAKERLAEFREAEIDRKLRSLEAMTKVVHDQRNRGSSRSPSPSLDLGNDNGHVHGGNFGFGNRAFSSVIRTISEPILPHVADLPSSSQNSSYDVDPETTSTSAEERKLARRSHAGEPPLAAITDVILEDLASSTNVAARASDQSWRCADCGMELFLPSNKSQAQTPGRSAENPSLLTSAVAMITSKLGSAKSSDSSLARRPSSQRQKTPCRNTDEPQLCFYTGKVFCGVCMDFNQMHIIPSKIVANWDIAAYPVSNFAFAYLRSICDDPIFTVKTLEHTLEIAPRLQAAHGIRKQLRVLVSVTERCDAAKEAFMAIHHSRYCGLSELYSMNDLVALHEASHPSISQQHEPGSASDVSYTSATKHAKQVLNLLSALKRMRDELAMHVVKQCSTCRERCVGRCPLCADQRSLYSFDIQKVVVCDECGALYHQPCFAASGRCVKHP